MTVGKLKKILDTAQGKRVAVIGDFMLDRHLKGTVRRISPEAPVPVVEIDSEMSGLGGAGNVVSNLAGLGLKISAFGAVGMDRAGETLVQHLSDCRCDTSGLLTIPDRKTSEKTRVIAGDQHVVRVDRESNSSISEIEQNRLIAVLEKSLEHLDAVILQDYNKGVLSEKIIRTTMSAARNAKVPVYVDPKFDNFFSYTGAHLFKPNIREVERALGLRVESDDELQVAANKLMSDLSPELLLITRGEKGLSLFNSRGGLTQIPTRARKVHDVSGAGDTVIAAFVASELGGASPDEAAWIANLAAGIVCEQVGVVPIERGQLIEEFTADDVGATSSAG